MTQTALQLILMDFQIFRTKMAREGIVAAVAHTISVLPWRFYPPRRRFANNLRAENSLAMTYDRLHDVETAGEVLLSEAGVSARDTKRGNGLYRAVWPRIFDHALKAVPLNFSNLTFVDYGSGKGKAMFLASEYSFKRIIGIEYAPALDEITQHNLRTFRSETQKCFDLTAERVDALNWTPPEGPILCHFFNPFDPPTQRKIIQRLVDFHLSSNSEIYILYINHRNVVECKKGFVHPYLRPIIAGHRNFLWYRISPNQ